MLSFLHNENLRLIIFGGKGGTGKTTSAAATALYVAKTHPRKKIMVISTDPAHSLGDSFNCPIGARKAPIGSFPNLWALEIDPRLALENFKRNHKRELNKLAERSGFYGQISLYKFLSFSLPGMDEIMVFLEIANLLKPDKGWLVLLDTAPTGHTLKLLSLPQRMVGWMDVFNISLKKYRTSPRVPFATVKVSKPKPGGDFVDDFVKDLRKRLEMVSLLLKDEEKCEFVPVTIPEPMSIIQTRDLVSTLEEMQIPVKNMIINQVQENKECPFCSSREREQEEAISEIEERFGKYNLIKVPLFPQEIRGEGGLATYAEVLCGKSPSYRVTSPTETLPELSFIPTSNLPRLLQSDRKFILFGGKGGVGKTSLAAATALYSARRYPDKKVLVYSIDPAHSLANSFKFPVGDKLTTIPGIDNLYALETDAAKLHRDFLEKISQLIRDAFETWEKHSLVKWDIRWDKQVMGSFAKVSPPGLDEALALEQIMGFVEEKKYDLYILDTAPTGHLLTLLEFPELIRDWLRYDYALLLKWNVQLPLTEVRDLGNLILKSTTLLRKIRQALADPQRSELVAITIPEAMGIAETEDLLRSLKRLNIPCRHIVINQIVPPTQCDFCAVKRKEQLKYVHQVKEMNDYLVTEIPLLSHETSGIDDLIEVAEIMYGKEVNHG
jgi:arsenite-transporting ATPase